MNNIVYCFLILGAAILGACSPAKDINSQPSTTTKQQSDASIKTDSRPEINTPTVSINTLLDDENQCKVEIQSYKDEGTLVFNSREIDYLMRGDIIDAPISLVTKKDGTTVWFLPTALQQNGKIYLSHTVVRGDLYDLPNSEVVVIDEEELFTESKAVVEAKKSIGRHWITNITQTKEGLLAQIHSEYTAEGDFFGMECIIRNDVRTCAPGVSKISLAWLPIEKFENDNYDFLFLGHLVGPASDIPHLNVHGTPWYVNTGEDGVEYLNLIYADEDFSKTETGGWATVDGMSHYIARVRAPFADVIKDAMNGEIGTWEKQYGNNWSENLEKPAVGILPKLRQKFNRVDKRLTAGSVIVHSDAIKHLETGRYFLSTYLLRTRSKPSRLVFYSSCDGEKWTLAGGGNPRGDGKSGWSYLTLLDRDNTDFGVAKKEFDVIAGFDYGKPKRSVYRMKVDIGDNCSCNN